MNRSIVLEYLSLLEQNNNQEWFHGHKEMYRAAKDAFENLVGELCVQLQRVDPAIPPLDPAKLTFKVQRDTRFSRDKSPYNPCFRAHIAPCGKLPIPVGYFLFLQPGGRSFLGGGLFADMFKDATTRIRDAIAAQGNAFQQIVTDPAFAAFTLGGTALKQAPRGYDPAHPQIAYIKQKSWYIEQFIPDEQVLGDDFIAYAVENFQKMQPFNAFLNRALEGFQMPAR